MKEQKKIWKLIEGFDNMYKVSNYGDIVSLHGKNERIVKPFKCSNNGAYRAVCLYKDGISKKIQVHRIVCMTFLPNPENKSSVNHKNGVKTDNRLENLEWCTRSENIQHAIKAGLIKTGHVKYDISKKIIDKVTGEIYLSPNDAANSVGETRDRIYRMLEGFVPNETNLLYLGKDGKPIESTYKKVKFSRSNPKYFVIPKHVKESIVNDFNSLVLAGMSRVDANKTVAAQQQISTSSVYTILKEQALKEDKQDES